MKNVPSPADVRSPQERHRLMYDAWILREREALAALFEAGIFEEVGFPFNGDIRRLAIRTAPFFAMSPREKRVTIPGSSQVYGECELPVNRLATQEKLVSRLQMFALRCPASPVSFAHLAEDASWIRFVNDSRNSPRLLIPAVAVGGVGEVPLFPVIDRLHLGDDYGRKLGGLTLRALPLERLCDTGAHALFRRSAQRDR